MKKSAFTLLTIILLLTSCKEATKNETVKTEDTPNLSIKKVLEIIPISHATMVLNYDAETIYVDPTGGKEAFDSQDKPTLILITDIHGDHYSFDTLKDIDLNEALIIAPQAVIDKFPVDFKPKYKVLKNGENTTFNDLKIEALPMYNLRKEALQFHPKGRGNGYILTFGNERIYISGDTEDITEMRNLKNIDKAFVCMNLPYTMTVESAASAVLEFKPKQVYPYHFRGTEGFSDVSRFKTLVNEGNTDIDVVQLDWYAKE